MREDDNRLVEWGIDGFQLCVRRVCSRCSPAALGRCMDQCEGILSPYPRQPAQPRQPLISKGGTGRQGYLPDRCPKNRRR